MWTRVWRSKNSRFFVPVSVSGVLAAVIANDDIDTHSKLRETLAEAAPSFEGLAPTPPIYMFRPNPNLEIAFDARTRNPVYVMERLVPASKSKKENSNNSRPRLKRPNFYEEKSLPEEFRSRQSHYRNSGYDRGHLAAAANYMDKTQEELGQTFNLINSSPQNQSMNRSIWNQLERWTMKVAEEHSNNENCATYVITGPLWMPIRQTAEKLFEYNYNAIGTPPSLVSVPTHLFKVVAVVEDNNRIAKYACFVVPNQEQTTRWPLEHYLVPWSNLEAATGLHFFPGLTARAAPDWKQRANLLTNEITARRIKGQDTPLLLTEGSSQTKAKWTWGKAKGDLVHLCADGKCR